MLLDQPVRRARPATFGGDFTLDLPQENFVTAFPPCRQSTCERMQTMSDISVSSKSAQDLLYVSLSMKRNFWWSTSYYRALLELSGWLARKMPVHHHLQPASPEHFLHPRELEKRSRESSRKLSWEPVDLDEVGAELQSEIKVPAPPARKKMVKAFYMAVLTFFSISGGPFGMEAAVRAAGPKLSLIAFLVLPFTWAIPQILMTTELSCLMSDTNGGYVVWTQRALGDFPAFITAWNCFFVNGIDAAIPPVLVGDYFAHTFDLGPETEGIAKLCVLLFCLYLNMRGIELVGRAAVLLAFFVTTPLLIFFIFAIPNIKPASWAGELPAGHTDWGLFVSTVLWAYSGFDDVGAIAAEVDEPVTTYFRGMFAGLGLALCCYVTAVISALTHTTSAEYVDWKNGFFAVAAREDALWLGHWMTLACAVSQIAQYNSNLATDARVVWSMASGAGGGGPSSIKLPRCLSYEWVTSEGQRVPVGGLLMQTCLVATAMNFEFKTLIQCDTVMNCLTLVLELSSFLVLKHTDDTPRGFAVPGGKLGAWLMAIPKFTCIFLFFYMSDVWVLFNVVCFNLFFVLLYIFKVIFGWPANVGIDGALDFDGTETASLLSETSTHASYGNYGLAMYIVHTTHASLFLTQRGT
eukprot:g26865.t1